MFLAPVDPKSTDEAIRAYANAGLRPILIHAPTADGCTCGKSHGVNDEGVRQDGKHPVARAWQKPQSIDELQNQLANLAFQPNVGIVLGEQPGGEYLIAIDVDDEDRFQKLIEEIGPLPPTVRGRSARGDRLLYEIPSDVDRTELKNITGLGGEKGVDVKAKGGQVLVAPSMHAAGVRYTWTNFGKIETLPPEWILAIKPTRYKVPEWASQYTPQTIHENKRARNRCERYLENAVLRDCALVASTREGGRNTLLYERTVALLSLCSGLHLGAQWSWVQQQLESAARAAGLGQTETHRTIASAEKWVRESGAVRIPVSLNDPPASSPPGGSPPPPPTPATPVGTVPLSMDQGRPAKTAENVALMLQQHPDWLGGPFYDTYSQTILWPMPLPRPISNIYRFEREIVDSDHAAIQGWLMSQPDSSRVRAGLDVVATGVHLAASRRSLDLLKEWFNAIEPWDRVCRIDSWTIKYLGVEPSLYARASGRAWLLAVAQRALTPGLHVDAIPVLEGRGGIGKNRSIEALFQGGPRHAPWLVTIAGHELDEDETKRLACTRWILQDDELRSSTPKRLEALKSWASRTVETYRLQYMREITVSPRRGLLVGSIDRENYLHDDNVRRWWPWRVGRIRPDLLAKERFQLFAEARERVREGEEWRDSMTIEAFGEANREAVDRRVVDPLLEQVSSLLNSPARCPANLTAHNIGSSLGYGIDKIDRAFEMRLGNVMRELGFTKGRKRDNDEMLRVYVKR